MVDESDDFHKLPGPILLLAGPGTGKTYRLAKRIKYLVEERGVHPENITVITFTSAAARNMHEKISDSSSLDTYVAVDKQPKGICTMHSLGNRIIAEMGKELGFSEDIRVLFSDRVREIIVEDAAQLAGYSREDGDETACCRQIGKCLPTSEKKCKICDQYEKILRQCSAVDHDDQILLACKLLKKHPSLLEKYQTLCQHLLVDEYQDINAAQFELISLLTESHRDGLFVVGDDDQSIYSWRGGSPSYIRSFDKDFGKDAKTRPLLKAFRCRPNVLEGALAVVKGFDKDRLTKGTFNYKKPGGSKIIIHNTPSDEQEAKVVLRVIRGALPTKSVLVLIPNKYFAAAIVQELHSAKIKCSAPLRMPGDGLPLVSVIAEWLRDPNDSIALRECVHAFIESPASGIPSSKARKPENKEQREVSLMSISRLWLGVLEGKTGNFWEALKDAGKQDKLCREIATFLENLIAVAQTDQDPADFMSKVITKFMPWKKISSMLEEVDSWLEASGRDGVHGQGPGIELMTFQGSKGLEADVVCVVGLEETIMPQTPLSEEHLAEQSRLMFVSMTRAKEELHLFHARKRSQSVMLKQLHFKGSPPNISPSRFLDVIPSGHKEIKYHTS